MAAKWEINVVDFLGQDLGELLGAGARQLTFQRNGPSSLSCHLPLTSDAAPLVSAGDRRIKAYRTSPTTGIDTLRFHGPIWAPEKSGSSGMNVVASDMWVALERRLTSFKTLAATDQGLLVQQLVESANTANGETGIRALPGNVTTSVARTVDWTDTAKPLSEVVTEFAGYFDGCDIELRPLDDVPGKAADLIVYGQRRGSVNDLAWFSYGPDTEANCTDATVVEDMSTIANYITARGDASVAPVVVYDQDSINRYGRYEAEISYTDVTLVDALTALAIQQLGLRKDPKRTITVTPGKEAPPIFDEWDIGDTVPIDIRKGVMQYTGPARVKSANVSIDDNGGETVTSITFDEDEIDGSS